jgi:hypothetical protein
MPTICIYKYCNCKPADCNPPDTLATAPAAQEILAPSPGHTDDNFPGSPPARPFVA